MGTTKELVTIEFRYMDAPKGEHDSGNKNKTITVGIFDTLDEAIEKGNEAIKELSKHFQVRADDNFMPKFLFGFPKRLVTNTCYPTKGIQYFAKITKLEFDDLNDTITETFSAVERYKEYKSKLELD